MSNHTADCCEQCSATASTTEGGTTARRADGGQRATTEHDTATPADRWLDEPVLAGTLPADLAATAAAFYGVERVETLGDFADATRAAAGGAIDPADLCHTDGPSPHRATAGDDTYQFQCFYDGLVLARLREAAIRIETVSPGGTPIDLYVSDDGTVDVAPSGAVVSFGVAADAPTTGDPTAEQVYGAVCPQVRAFPSREAYMAWAAATDAPTVGLSLAAGLPVAASLIGRAPRPDGNS